MKVNLKGIMPTALIFVGVAGVVGTCIACGKDTVKAQEELKKLEAEGVKFETKRDKVKSLWKCYIPTIATGGFTILSISMAGYLNHKTEMALAAALALNKDNLKKFESKAREIVGEEKVREIKKEVSKEAAVKSEVRPPKKDICEGMIRIWDPYVEDYIDTTPEKLSLLKLTINEELAKRSEVCYNKVLKVLGHKTSKNLESFGWSLDNEIQTDCWSYEPGYWIDIWTDEIEIDGIKVLSLCYNVAPEVQIPAYFNDYDTFKKAYSI